MTVYYRPMPSLEPFRPAGALPLAGGRVWFHTAERIERGRLSECVPATEIPETVLAALTRPRTPLLGLALDTPRLMGIVNVTPDSFSDGGQFDTTDTALARALALRAAGADILDIGGESTRPGADTVPDAIEIARIAPVIAGLARETDTPVSIDTRKSAVAEAALSAGARIVNDVSALTYDPGLAGVVASSRTPICLMHAKGEPKTMADDPRYEDVLLDVYDALAARIAAATAAGIDPKNILIDPGIGFGKTLGHNLVLLRNLSLFHSLGCPILLGVSRKRFIGVIGNAPNPADRLAGSLAMALAALAQGVQILRVHDIVETKQALRLHLAVASERI